MRGQRQFHGPIDGLQSIEELLDRDIGLFNLGPPRRERLVGSPPHEMQTHLHAAKQVAAAMAEGTETLTKLFRLPFVLDECEEVSRTVRPPRKPREEVGTWCITWL